MNEVRKKQESFISRKKFLNKLTGKHTTFLITYSPNQNWIVISNSVILLT